MINFVLINIIHTPLIFFFHLFHLRFRKSKIKFVYLINSLILSIIINFINLIIFYNSSILKIENIIIIITIQISAFLIYAEFFSMICRGFSLRILTDVYLNKTVPKNKISSIYSSDKGYDWLLKKRLDSITNIGLIKRKDYYYKLSNTGRVVSQISIFTKKIMKLGKGGE